MPVPSKGSAQDGRPGSASAAAEAPQDPAEHIYKVSQNSEVRNTAGIKASKRRCCVFEDVDATCWWSSGRGMYVYEVSCVKAVLGVSWVVPCLPGER